MSACCWKSPFFYYIFLLFPINCCSSSAYTLCIYVPEMLLMIKVYTRMYSAWKEGKNIKDSPKIGFPSSITPHIFYAALLVSVNIKWQILYNGCEHWQKQFWWKLEHTHKAHNIYKDTSNKYVSSCHLRVYKFIWYKYSKLLCLLI